jgi:hypothetical protein
MWGFSVLIVATFVFDWALFVRSFYTKCCENRTKALVSDISLQERNTVMICKWLLSLRKKCLGYNTRIPSITVLRVRFTVLHHLRHILVTRRLWKVSLHSNVWRLLSTVFLPSQTEPGLCPCRCAVTSSWASQGHISFFVTLIVTEFCGIHRSGTATHFVHLGPHNSNNDGNKKSNKHDGALETGQTLGNVG